MKLQDENKQQKFDQEVDSVLQKSKRKLSEGQLKALAEGRRKRWEKKRSKTSDVSAITEETPSELELEKRYEEEKRVKKSGTGAVAEETLQMCTLN